VHISEDEFQLPAQSQGPTLMMVKDGVVYRQNAIGSSNTYDSFVPAEDTTPTDVQYSAEDGITLYDPDSGFNHMDNCENFKVKIQGPALTMLLSSYEGDTEQEKFDNLMESDPAFFDNMLKTMSEPLNFTKLNKFSTPNKDVMEKRAGALLALHATIPEGSHVKISFYHDDMWLQGSIDD